MIRSCELRVDSNSSSLRDLPVRTQYPSADISNITMGDSDGEIRAKSLELLIVENKAREQTTKSHTEFNKDTNDKRQRDVGQAFVGIKYTMVPINPFF